MAIESICKTDVVTLAKNATLKDAAQLMQKNHVGSIVVTKSLNGKRVPTGIITDRDIALSLSNSSNPQELKVENIMQSQPVTVETTEGVYQVMDKMRKHGVKRIPVVDQDGSLRGIICSDDLLDLLAREISHLAKTTEMQIKKEQGSHMPVQKHVV